MPSAVIGALRVDLSANTAAFSAGLNRAQGDLTKFGAAASGMAGKVAGVLGLGLGIGAVVQLAGAARKAVGDLGDLADAATRAGVSAEKLQVFRFALSQAGGDAAAADDALTKFNLRLGDVAEKGAGPAADALKKLGISVRDAEGNIKPTEAVLGEVMDKLAGVKDQARVASLAGDIFGDKLGPKLLGLLAQGSAGLKLSEDQMRSLGNLMSNEMVAKGDALDDQFNAIASTLDVKFKQGVISAITALQGLKTEMDEIAKSADEGDWWSFFFGKEKTLTRLPGGLRAPDLSRPAESLGLGPDAFPPDDPAGRKAAAKAAEKVQQEREALQARVDMVREMLLTSREAEQNDFAQRMIELQDFNSQRLLSDQEYAEMSGTLAAEHADRLKQLDLEVSESQRQAAEQRAGALASIMGSITGALGDLFGDSKDAAIAMAIINTAQSVTSTLAQFGFTPWGIAAAAAAAAAGLVQISTIRSTSPGSGGSVSAPSSAGEAASAASQPAQQQGSPMQVRISGVDRNSFYSGAQLGNLFDALRQEAGDRGLSFVT